MRWPLLFLLSISIQLNAAQNSSTGTANWESAAAWSLGRVPMNGDTIFIQVGHTITVSTVNTTLETGNPVYLEVFGTLNFATGKKLSLACRSGVALKTGPPAGRLTSGGGGGASNQLSICNTTVWQSSDGNKTGPMSYGDPLPVKLISFNAIFDNGKVDLSWSTASEVNNDFFTIEKSRDGKTFEEVSRVKGSGTSNSLMEYFDTDYEPFKGISYYRLKQTDFNGDETVSPVVPVNYIVKDDGFKIYPNPAVSGEKIFVQLQNTEPQETLVVLRDISGVEHYSKLIISNENNSLVAIDPEKRLASGSYLIIASSNNQIFSQKIIVR